jgi:hypothetical protein
MSLLPIACLFVANWPPKAALPITNLISLTFLKKE